MVCNLILKVSSRKLAMEIVIKMVKYYQLLPVGVLKLLVIALNLLESCLLYTAILYFKLLGLYNNFAKTWIRNYYNNSCKLAISVFIIFEFCLYHKLFFERPLCKSVVYTNVTVFCIWITHFFTYFFSGFLLELSHFPYFTLWKNGY